MNYFLLLFINSFFYQTNSSNLHKLKISVDEINIDTLNSKRNDFENSDLSFSIKIQNHTYNKKKAGNITGNVARGYLTNGKSLNLKLFATPEFRTGIRDFSFTLASGETIYISANITEFELIKINRNYPYFSKDKKVAFLKRIIKKMRLHLLESIITVPNSKSNITFRHNYHPQDSIQRP